jgi:hypothetical protein
MYIKDDKAWLASSAINALAVSCQVVRSAGSGRDAPVNESAVGAGTGCDLG